MDGGSSIFDKVQQRQAATAADELMRKGEVDSALTLYSLATHTHANDHVAATILDSNSIDLSITGQQISASLKLSSTDGPGLEILTDGVKVLWGTTATTVPRGNHTHANDHVAATAGVTDSLTMIVTGQAITGNVRLAPSSGLQIVSGGTPGLAIDYALVAAASHVHSNATNTVTGFLSSADWIRFDGVAVNFAGALPISSVLDTGTIDLTLASGVLSAAIKIGAGLKEGGVRATGTLTATANVANAETVTIGSKVYTFQTTLTNVDGNVLIGASLSASISNLQAAINLGAGSGTVYAAATTAHPTVTCSGVTTTTLTVQAISVGTGGNAIATTETCVNASWGGATLSGGINADLQVDYTQVAAFSHTHAAATAGANGFMSAADKSKLDGLPSSMSSPLVTSISNALGVQLVVTSGALTANLQLGVNSGLQIAGAGLGCVFGTGANQVAMGNHTHTNDHVAATILHTDSIQMGLVGQQVSANVRLTTGSGLQIISGATPGLSVQFGATATTVAAGNHVHADATESASGFFSTADKTLFDAKRAHFENMPYFVSVLDTSTIDMTLTAGGIMSAAVRIGPGLRVGGAKATGVFSVPSFNVQNGETVTIGGKTYTFQTTLTNVDGNVWIDPGGTPGTMAYLRQAIGLTGSAGVAYAAAMTAHPTVNAPSSTATSVTFEAKLGGTGGNSIATTETSVYGSFGSATLTGGTDVTLDVDFAQAAAAVHIHDNATTSTNGFMSSADKTKLDGLSSSGYVTSVNTLTGAVSLTTTNIGEGTNLYHTGARVRGLELTGIDVATTGTVSASDSILIGIGKLAATSLKKTSNLSELTDVAAARTALSVYSQAEVETILSARDKKASCRVATTAALPAHTRSGNVLTSSTGVKAAGTLTATANFANAETVTIGTKTYTFQTTLTNVDGNVLIGATLSASLTNLQAAINLGAGSGTTYAAATIAHPSATCSSVTATTLVAQAILFGVSGNSIATTETSATASWGAATMAGGVDAGPFPVTDGVTLVDGNRILVKDEGSGTHLENGPHTVTVGNASTAWTLTRTTDADTSADVTDGLEIWIQEGAVNLNRHYTLTTNDPITLNTTALTFALVYLPRTGGTMTGALTINVSSASALVINTDALVVDSTSKRIGIGIAVPLGAIHASGSTNGLLRSYFSNTNVGANRAQDIAIVTNLSTNEGLFFGVSQAVSGYKSYLDNRSGGHFQFQNSSAAILTLQTDGISKFAGDVDIASTKVLKVNSLQVVGSRIATSIARVTNTTGNATLTTFPAMVNMNALTAASGTASTTINDVGPTFSQTTLNNNFKSFATEQEYQRVLSAQLINCVATLTAKVNALRSRLCVSTATPANEEVASGHGLMQD